MEQEAAVRTVEFLRSEVVTLVGICGRGTHPLSDLLEDLKEGRVRPEEAVEKATKIRNSVSDFR